MALTDGRLVIKIAHGEAKSLADDDFALRPADTNKLYLLAPANYSLPRLTGLRLNLAAKG